MHIVCLTSEKVMQEELTEARLTTCVKI